MSALLTEVVAMLVPRACFLSSLFAAFMTELGDELLSLRALTSRKLKHQVQLLLSSCPQNDIELLCRLLKETALRYA